MNIKFCKTTENAVIPTKRDEDAAFDLYATAFELCPPYDPIKKDIADGFGVLRPGDSVKFYTGLKAIIPDDVWILFKERSSTGAMGLSIRSGVIDSGYRGEWIITMTNCSSNMIYLKSGNEKPYFKNGCWVMELGKAVAQFIVMPKSIIGSEEISEDKFDEAPKTQRGEGGFGSSGK